MKRPAALLTLATAATLAACATTATPYQPDLPGQRIPGGYYDERLSEGRYRLTFSAVPSTPRSAMKRAFTRRAAELALENGFDWFSVHNEAYETDVYVYTSPDGSYRVRYSGGYQGWRSYWRLFRYELDLGHIPDDPLWPHRQRPHTSRRIEYSADIRMGRGPPPDPAISQDARRVLGRSGR